MKTFFIFKHVNYMSSLSPNLKVLIHNYFNVNNFGDNVKPFYIMVNYIQLGRNQSNDFKLIQFS